jgi:cardiolipin synthase
MSKYRVRDLLMIPSLLSLMRIPLAVLFPIVIFDKTFAFVIMVIAGLSDIFDGWYARRFNQITAIGTLIDPITDKFFVLSVAFTLVLNGDISFLHILMLGAREVGELPLVLYLSYIRYIRLVPMDQPKANIMGKFTTLIQFAAVTSVLFFHILSPLLFCLAAVIGIIAAGSYWWRTFYGKRLHWIII